MPQDVSSEGMGMQNLKNRVETLQGVLRIESEPQKGTKVSVNIQL